jgi:hypothetical protein
LLSLAYSVTYTQMYVHIMSIHIFDRSSQVEHRHNLSVRKMYRIDRKIYISLNPATYIYIQNSNKIKTAIITAKYMSLLCVRPKRSWRFLLYLK